MNVAAISACACDACGLHAFLGNPSTFGIVQSQYRAGVFGDVFDDDDIACDDDDDDDDDDGDDDNDDDLFDLFGFFHRYHYQHLHHYHHAHQHLYLFRNRLGPNVEVVPVG